MINLGVIGMSDGNGHPYSWSAIINGYDIETMQTCPFPVIPEYLGQYTYPGDFINGARVTHIWTQDDAISQHVARASKIETVVNTPEDMIGKVDGILLARDDYQNHMRFAGPFLEAGLPVYIDKPLANSVSGANDLLDLQKFSEQIFTCSALRYLPELKGLKNKISEIRTIDTHTPKSWSMYAIHIIEPIAALLNMHDNDQIALKNKTINGEAVELNLCYKNTDLSFKSSGTNEGQIFYNVTFKDGSAEKIIVSDVFIAFRSALEAFLKQVQDKKLTIERKETLSCMHIIEMGKN